MKPSAAMTLLHSSLADIPEGSLVRQLLRSQDWRSQLLNIDGFPENALDYQNLPLAGPPGNPRGDIDILLCNSTQPEQATVIQVKRIKVGTQALLTGNPNKLSAYAEGVQQTNLLADIGFWQVYMYVFVVVDSRAQNTGRISYDGLSPELEGKLRNFFSPTNLRQRIGLVCFEFVQPMDFTPLGPGTSETHLVRRANTTTVSQPAAVTNWVAHQVATRLPDGPPSRLIIPRANWQL